MNFGLLGTLLVPALISFLIARTFVNAKERQTPAAYFLLFSFLGMFLRGAMYQTFAYYNPFLTAIILLFCFAAVHAVLGRSRAVPIKPPQLIQKEMTFIREARVFSGNVIDAGRYLTSSASSNVVSL